MQWIQETEQHMACEMQFNTLLISYQNMNDYASRLLIGHKICWPKVKHPKLEGHVTPNDDEYQKSV